MTLELLISAEEIQRKIGAIAPLIDAYYAGEELTIVMVMKGAICLTADLIRALKTPTTLEYIRASSYGHRGTQKGELVLSGVDELDLESRHVLLVDDIFDSGETLGEIATQLKKKGPKSLKTLVLLSVTTGATRSLPDYTLFHIEKVFVVGYGLDYKEHYRGLPGIYALRGCC